MSRRPAFRTPEPPPDTAKLVAALVAVKDAVQARDRAKARHDARVKAAILKARSLGGIWKEIGLVAGVSAQMAEIWTRTQPNSLRRHAYLHIEDNPDTPQLPIGEVRMGDELEMSETAAEIKADGDQDAPPLEPAESPAMARLSAAVQALSSRSRNRRC